MLDSRGIVKNIDILTSEIVEDASNISRAEEDCESDSDSISDNDARKMFSSRSIKDLSLQNFQKFKLLNQESHVLRHFQSARQINQKDTTKQKPSFPSSLLPKSNRYQTNNEIDKNRGFFHPKQKSQLVAILENSGRVKSSGSKVAHDGEREDVLLQ